MKQKNISEVAHGRRSLMIAAAMIAAAASSLISLSIAAEAEEVFIPSSIPEAPRGGAMVTGEAVALTATGLQLELRDGRLITVDLSTARQDHSVSSIHVGEYLVVQGSLSAGLMTAQSAFRAKSNPDAWMPDIP